MKRFHIVVANFKPINNLVLKIVKEILPSSFYQPFYHVLRIIWRCLRFVFRLPDNIRQNYKEFVRVRNDPENFINEFGIQYRAIAGYRLIDGWLTDSQAVKLFNLTLALTDNPVVVEIGAWQGKSSVVLGKGIQNKKNAILFCIDPFDASGDKISEERAYRPYLQNITKNFWQRAKYPLLERFKRNLKINRVDKIITILHGYSQDFSQLFSERIDLLFIDGNHEYASVKRDFEEWSLKLKSGGILILHDVDFDPFKEPSGKEDQTGPGQVAQEHIIYSKDWRNITMVDNMLIATRC
jgi:predicted O-methyltransferase YrrM